MVPCGATISLKPPPPCARLSSNRGPSSHFGLQTPSLETPLKIKCSFRHNHRLEFKDFGRLQMQCGSLRFTNFRVSASSGDGSGNGFGSAAGDGGYGGYGHENNGGGGGDNGEGGNGWSFLPW